MIGEDTEVPPNPAHVSGGPVQVAPPPTFVAGFDQGTVGNIADAVARIAKKSALIRRLGIPGAGSADNSASTRSTRCASAGTAASAKPVQEIIELTGRRSDQRVVTQVNWIERRGDADRSKKVS